MQLQPSFALAFVRAVCDTVTPAGSGSVTVNAKELELDGLFDSVPAANVAPELGPGSAVAELVATPAVISHEKLSPGFATWFTLSTFVIERIGPVEK